MHRFDRPAIDKKENAMPRHRSLLRTLGRLPFITLLSASLLSACLFSTPVGPFAAQTSTAAAMEPIVFTRVSESSIDKLQFSPSGAEALVATHAEVVIFSAETFSLKKRIEPSDSIMIYGSGFIDDNNFYIGYSAVGEVPFKVYSLGTWDEVFSYDLKRGSGTDVWANKNFANYGSVLLNWRTGQAFDSDTFSRSKQVHLTHDNRLVFPEFNGWVRIENPVDGDRVDWDAGNGKTVLFLMDTPDNNYLVTMSINGLCRVWKRESKPVSTGHCGEANTDFWKKLIGMSSLPEQNRFAVSFDSIVRAYQIDGQTGHAALNLEINAKTPVTATAISKRAQVALSTEDGRIELWDLPTMQLVATYQPDTPSIARVSQEGLDWKPRLLEFSPDGNTLLVGMAYYLVALKVPE